MTSLGSFLATCPPVETGSLARQFASSRSHLEQAFAHYDPISHGSLLHQVGYHPEVSDQGLLGTVLFCLGYPEQALSRINAAIAEARRLAHPPTLAMCFGYGIRLLSLDANNVGFREWVDQLNAMAAEQGFPMWRAEATIYRGWAKVQAGDKPEGISLLRSGSAAYRATGAEIWRPHHIALLARAYAIAGQIEEAVTLVDDAVEILERTGERWLASELHRYKGQFLQRQGHTNAAEQLYGNALTIAREQGAKLWELRATMSLARLRRDQGRRAEALDLLAPIYGWFTEGFDTPDLKEVKALLEELGRACPPAHGLLSGGR